MSTWCFPWLVIIEHSMPSWAVFENAKNVNRVGASLAAIVKMFTSLCDVFFSLQFLHLSLFSSSFGPFLFFSTYMFIPLSL